MNREIMFKVWDKIDKQFTVLNIGNLRDDYSFDDYIDDTFNDPNSRYILLQYTGLKDSKGVEIYEGDIISFDGGPYDMQDKYSAEVKWDGEQAVFEAYSSEYVDFLANIENPIIIGNIFENPELM